jgi:hypothetical protein
MQPDRRVWTICCVDRAIVVCDNDRRQVIVNVIEIANSYVNMIQIGEI